MSEVGYDAIRKAILGDRKKRAEVLASARRKGFRRSRVKVRENEEDDERPPAIDRSVEGRMVGVLEAGMQIAERTQAVEMRANLLRATTELRRQLMFARKMRRRLRGEAYRPEEMTAEEGKRWLIEQLMELGDEARDVANVPAAMAAYTALAHLAGHSLTPLGQGGAGMTLNFNLADMVARIEAEDDAKLIEGKAEGGV